MIKVYSHRKNVFKVIGLSASDRFLVIFCIPSIDHRHLFAQECTHVINAAQIPRTSSSGLNIISCSENVYQKQVHVCNYHSYTGEVLQTKTGKIYLFNVISKSS